MQDSAGDRTISLFSPLTPRDAAKDMAEVSVTDSTRNLLHWLALNLKYNERVKAQIEQKKKGFCTSERSKLSVRSCEKLRSRGACAGSALLMRDAV